MALLDSKIPRRDFLKGGIAAAASLTAAGVAGCASSGADGETESLANTSATDMKAHVVDSDTAILNNKGEWVAVDCPWNCGGVRCINFEYIVDGVPIRHKTVDDIEDTEEMPQIRACPRGTAHRQLVLGADRVKYPMKRKNWQPGGGANSHGELRGVDEWERISWDEALDLVASEMDRVYTTYGPSAVMAFDGWGYQFTNHLGGTMGMDGTQSSGNFLNSTTQLGLDYYAWMPAMNSSNDRTDLVNADTIVLYGVNSPMANGGNSSYYFKLAQEKGVKFISVAPNYNMAANLLDAKWIQVRPGTDTAFLLAVAYEMLRLDGEGKNIIDWDFLHKYCVGFDEESMPADAKINENLKGYILGEYDGQPKTPEWASEISGTPIEDITWYAEQLGKEHNVTILHAFAPARCNGAEDYPQMLLTTGWMGGHVGRPGNATGVSFGLQGANCGPYLVDYGPASAYGVPPAGTLTNNAICMPEAWQCILEKKYKYRGNAGNSYPGTFVLVPEVEQDVDIKLALSGISNPMQTRMNVPAAIEAVRSLETFIVADTRNHLTASFADILLPTTMAWEGNLDKSKGESDLSSNFMFLQLNNHERDHVLFPAPAIMPLYEHKSTAWIMKEIMKRLDLDWESMFPLSAAQEWYDKLSGVTFLSEDGQTYEKLFTIGQDVIDEWGVVGEPQTGVCDFRETMKKGYFQLPRKNGDNRGFIAYEDFIKDPEANPRPSASGKFEIYCQAKADSINATGYAKTELKPYPTYREARQTYTDSFTDWSKKVKGEFPYQVYTPHYMRRAHTAFDSCVSLQEAFQNPVFISAVDAKEKGVQTGDTVLVRSATGKILRKASVTQTLMPGVIALPHGARTDYDFENGIDRGGNDNTLTSRAQQSEWFPQCECYNSLLVDFEKFVEEIPDDFEKEPVVFLKED